MGDAIGLYWFLVWSVVAFVLVSGVVGGDPTGLCWFDLPLLRRSESLGLTLG